MAYFQVRNSRNPSKAIVCGITYRQLVDKNSQDGEAIWVLEIATDELDTNGDPIPPYFINLTSEVDVDLEIEKAVAYISEKVDWQPLSDDLRPPYVIYAYPTDEARIQDNVKVTIKESHPSEGINIDSIQMFVNGFDVTDDLEINGDEFEYRLLWKPPSRVYAQL